MTSLLGTPEDLLEELQRDRRLPRSPTADRCNPILDLCRSNLVDSPPSKLAHRTQGLHAAHIR
jgi:hypothetical protein